MTSRSVKDSVLRFVDQDALVSLASDLIKIPSFKPNETLVADYLLEFFTERGYTVDLQEVEPGRRQVIATIKGSSDERSLMLNGHTDINALTMRWKRDPWTPVVEGDRLYGHGVQNMKAGLASIIMAAESVRLAHVNLAGDVVVACVVGETQGGEGTYHLMQTGFRTSAAVVAEPFGLGNIATVHAGIVHMAIHTYGITGHISRLQGTINAVEKMTSVIRALQCVRFTYDAREDLPDLPRLNVGSVIGGRGNEYVLVEPPYIPDLCTILVDVHFVPGQTVEGIVADIKLTLDSLVSVDPDLRYRIEVPPPDFFEGRRRLVMDPLDVPTDTPIVRLVARCHQEITGEAPKIIGSVLPNSYSSNDTCHLWKSGIPCLIYGPGTVRGGQDEDDCYAYVSEMVQATKVYALTILDHCGVE